MGTQEVVIAEKIPEWARALGHHGEPEDNHHVTLTHTIQASPVRTGALEAAVDSQSTARGTARVHFAG